MTTLVPFTRTDLEKALTPEQLRVTKIIRIALMLGITLFYALVLLPYFLVNPERFNLSDVFLMNTLSLVHGVFTLIATAAAFFLSKMILRRERLSNGTPEKVALQAVALHRVSSLLLMAPIEGAAFFGAVVCMVGIQNKLMQFMPIYLLNSASAVLLIVVGLITFPTRERVLGTLESAFLQQ